MTSILRLQPALLTRGLFAPFGDVIERAGHPHYTINDGNAERYSDLAAIDVGAQDGRIRINIFHAAPRRLPLPIRMVERHPLSSQAFVAMSERPFLVVVAAPGKAPRPDDLHAPAGRLLHLLSPPPIRHVRSPGLPARSRRRRRRPRRNSRPARRGR